MAPQGSLREMILNKPALEPPLGVEHDFSASPHFRSEMLGVNISMLLLATFAVMIRIYTKMVILKKMAIEDYLIIAAWLMYTAGYHTINFIMLNMKGAGEHQWNVHVRDLIPFAYYLMIESAIYGLVVMQIKAAIILQCLRVLVPTGIRNVSYWVFHVLLWAHVIFYMICMFVEIFMCSPRSKAWDPTVLTGHCMDSKAVNTAAAAINTASDLILVLIPQVVIWGLNMPTRRKWAVSVVFLVGVLASAAAAVRMYYCIDLYRTKDYTWGVTMMGLWVHVEVGLGFLVACIPVFPRFFKQQPIFLSIGSSLRSVFRLRSSNSTKHDGERLGSTDLPSCRKQPLVSDIEFEELVMRTDISRGTTE
ncbi:hypothetical protein CC86DRAFT_410694 [Ophiobolus disseminans]|uniref:Rhodopsin domain-containing protein n=1 Tax=Ophiobolus disseminans TaxID=1469910 RepID=A0A6A6ZKI3_9PLEO|nr:hypothetical protein CC86DRAFT_410694 [Ophiobolus disseminans]